MGYLLSIPFFPSVIYFKTLINTIFCALYLFPCLFFFIFQVLTLEIVIVPSLHTMKAFHKSSSRKKHITFSLLEKTEKLNNGMPIKYGFLSNNFIFCSKKHVLIFLLSRTHFYYN